MSRRAVAGGALLLLVTVAAYLPALSAGFVWDDDVYVTANPVLRDLHGLAAAWTRLDATPQYYPLTHTSLFLDHALWGLDPRGYHAVNLLLHAASAIVVWRLLARLGVPGAWLGAALFAVHPVQAESVAWVTERKNTLSGLLYLGSASILLGSFLGGARDAARRPIGVVLYLGALLAKSVTATLPIAVALVLWWKRGRLARREVAWLAPLLLLGAAMGALTRHLESTQLGAAGGAWALTLPGRVVLAGRIAWFYLGKLAWPADLVFIYPRWVVDASRPVAWVAPCAVAVLLALLAAGSRRIGRAPFAAFAFFLVTLAPASGFFNVYPMRYSWVADHFQYLACLGPLALFAAGAALALGPRHRRAGLALAASLVATLAVLTFVRTRAYAGEETLWRDTLARNPSAWIAHNNLGILLAKDGRRAEAEEHFRRVLALEPGHTGALANLGYLLELDGRDAEAADVLARAVAARPDDRDAAIHLMRALIRLGRHAEALPAALAAARLAPDNPDALCDAGALLASQGRAAEAIPLLTRALALRPEFPRARANLDRARRDAVSSPVPPENPAQESPR